MNNCYKSPHRRCLRRIWLAFATHIFFIIILHIKAAPALLIIIQVKSKMRLSEAATPRCFFLFGFLLQTEAVLLRPAALLKKRLWQRCFPVNFAKFLRTPFLQNTSGGCFCTDTDDSRDSKGREQPSFSL